MIIRNRFLLAGAPDQVFRTLINLDEIAGCVAGATLEPDDGDVRRGAMDVRFGMMRFRYQGTFRFLEIDPASQRAVIQGEGEEAAGQGTARATVEIAVSQADAERSAVDVVTDVNLTGSVAQLGHGLIEEVAQEIMDDFARALEARRAVPAAARGAEVQQDIAPARQLDSLSIMWRMIRRRIARLFGANSKGR